MARKDSTDPVSSILMLLLCLIAIIFSIIIFSATVFANFALFSFPLFIVLGILRYRNLGKQPPLADPSQVDMSTQIVAITALVRELRSWRKVRVDKYEEGRVRGLYLTQKSGETRFDIRSKFGRELNASLDEADAKIPMVELSILGFKLDWPHSTLKQWRDKYDQWTIDLSYKTSFILSTIIAIITTVILYIIELVKILGNFNYYIMDRRGYSILLGPLAGGAIAGYVSYFFFFRILKTWSSIRLEKSDKSRWVELRKLVDAWERYNFIWSHNSDPCSYFIDKDDKASEQQDDSHRPTESTGETWYEILEVSENATETEIKEAYRDKIKGYHPDKLVGLGEKIQELGEQMSQRINAAYEEAKVARNLS